MAVSAVLLNLGTNQAYEPFIGKGAAAAANCAVSSPVTATSFSLHFAAALGDNDAGHRPGEQVADLGSGERAADVVRRLAAAQALRHGLFDGRGGLGVP